MSETHNQNPIIEKLSPKSYKAMTSANEWTWLLEHWSFSYFHLEVWRITVLGEQHLRESQLRHRNSKHHRKKIEQNNPPCREPIRSDYEILLHEVVKCHLHLEYSTKRHRISVRIWVDNVVWWTLASFWPGRGLSLVIISCGDLRLEVSLPCTWSVTIRTVL